MAFMKSWDSGGHLDTLRGVHSLTRGWLTVSSTPSSTGRGNVDEFIAEQANQRTAGMPGWWERAQNTLDPDQWASLNAAADNPAISHRTISVVLARWGVKVTPGMVGHWRRNVR